MRKAIAVLAACLAALALYGFTRMRSYIKEDPRFCASCHQASPEFTLWSGGQHGGVACQKCHHATTDEGLAMLRAFLAGGKPGPHAPINIGACSTCHLTHDKEWINIGASRGHRVHVVQQKIACVACHGGGVHRFEPATESCKSCHGDHAIRAPGMQKLHCFACHDFLSVEATLRPTRRDCLRCHRDQGVHPARFPDDAPMRFACAACHKPHAPVAAERVGCETCHKEMAKAGLHKLPAHRECAACHRAHSWRSECADCSKCHQGMTLLTCSSAPPWRTLAALPNRPRGN